MSVVEIALTAEQLAAAYTQLSDEERRSFLEAIFDHPAHQQAAVGGIGGPGLGYVRPQSGIGARPCLKSGTCKERALHSLAQSCNRQLEYQNLSKTFCWLARDNPAHMVLDLSDGSNCTSFIDGANRSGL